MKNELNLDAKILLFILGFILLLSACTANEIKKTTNGPPMTYEEMVQFYAQNFEISEKEADQRLNLMQIHSLHTDTEKYRILSAPISDTEESSIYFVVISEEKEGEWKIKAVEAAWVGSDRKKDLSYMGDINYWIRGEKSLEYVIEGDLCAVAYTSVAIQKTEDDEKGTMHFLNESGKTVETQVHISANKTEHF